MIDTVKPLTAKAKLAVSRADLLSAMGYEEIKGRVNDAAKVVELPEPVRTSILSNVSEKVSRSVVGSWWRRNPLSSVVQLSEPFLENYAKRHPAKLVAYGAGAGALLWILKPWRLLSVATVVGLVLKSSDITGVITDVIKKNRDQAQ
jgi:hypothetical protein